MPGSAATMRVRTVNPQVSVIDVEGQLTAQSENALMDAYTLASTQGVRAIILNFADLEYMNSTGIGLLVTLLVRMKRQHQQLMAIGVSDHYRHIFELTRLDEAIRIFPAEGAAVAAAESA